MSGLISRPTPRKVLVCAGDSITHGRGSADYVGSLKHRLRTNDFQVFNAGVGGDLAWNLLQRIDHVIARRPDVVVVLIGTNDVNATVNPAVGTYLRLSKRLPRMPTLDWYVECVGQILSRLQNETSARLAVLDIPMIGEDLESAMNGRVDKYNEVLRQVASSRGVTCLPLHDRLISLLPAGHQPPPYRGRLNVVASAVVRHRLLRQSWDSVAAHNGLAVLTDHIHLSDRGAGVVADLIEQFLALPSRQPGGLS
jgi:acyl-CoA thioesterase I